jgi:hypothetical protein
MKIRPVHIVIGCHEAIDSVQIRLAEAAFRPGFAVTAHTR